MNARRPRYYVCLKQKLHPSQNTQSRDLLLQMTKKGIHVSIRELQHAVIAARALSPRLTLQIESCEVYMFFVGCSDYFSFFFNLFSHELMIPTGTCHQYYYRMLLAYNFNLSRFNCKYETVVMHRRGVVMRVSRQIFMSVVFDIFHRWMLTSYLFSRTRASCAQQIFPCFCLCPFLYEFFGTLGLFVFLESPVPTRLV